MLKIDAQALATSLKHQHVSIKSALNRRSTNSQSGITLVELMISMTLGLLITAAVMQVFLVSSRTSVIQSSGSKLVETNIFGLQNIEKRLKLVNLGLAKKADAKTAGSGVVVNQLNLLDVKHADDSPIDITLLTQDSADTVGLAAANQWTGASNTDTVSDQLTVQYRAPQDMVDCEGNEVLGPRNVTLGGVTELADGLIVIERYYLRSTTDNGLVLACDAGRYMNTKDITLDAAQDALSDTSINYFKKPSGGYTINRIKGFGDEGVVLIPNVDDFQVLLGVMTETGIRYVTSSSYIDPNVKVSVGNDEFPIGDYPIVAIKIGIIARGDLSLPGSEEGKTTFNLFGETLTLKSSTDKNLIRKEYESEIVLRNARIVN